MSLLSNLNPEQKRAVTYCEGPLLIIAGAGTGKTTVITQKLAYLIENEKVNPQAILALTFTEKAAQEMEERIDQLLPYGYLDLWISTFHSFAERILYSHALDIGLPTDFQLLDETNQWLLFKTHLNRFPLDYYRPLGNPSKFIYALIKHFSRLKDQNISPEEYLDYVSNLTLDKDGLSPQDLVGEKDRDHLEIKRLKEVALSYHLYQQLLLENKALDFGDLINYTLRLFKERPQILEKYRTQFQYILVDEFQDTNLVQYELIKLLALPKNNLTMVADDDQAIYRWRGASYHNLVQFQKDFPLARQIFLVQNYRSCQNILDLAYQFIQLNNPDRLEAQTQGLGLSKRLKTVFQTEALIQYLSANTLEEEVQLVVNKILELKEKDKELSWNDFAILVRANNEAPPFVSGLYVHNIPNQFLASKGLYLKPVIIDLVSYLRVLQNYYDSPSFFRVLTFPFLNIKNEDLVQINHWSAKKSQSLFETCQKISLLPHLSEETIKIIHHLISLITKHSALQVKSKPSLLMLTCLKELGYWDYLNKKETKESKESFDYLNQFYKKLNSWEKAKPAGFLKDFLEDFKAEMEGGEEGALEFDWETGPEMVKVLTVHSAKGLEFGYVFIVNLVDRRFPTQERNEPIEIPLTLIKEMVPVGEAHLGEERRLFYVAMTRAKKGLFLTGASDYGGKTKKKPSRFLYELGILDKSNAWQKGMAKSSLNNADRIALSFNERERFLNLNQSQPISTNLNQFSSYLPTRFSYTQLKVFETCPYQYRFAHILRVPVWGRPTFSFGSTMHLTLQRFFTIIKEKQNLNQTPLFGEKRVDLKNSQPKEIDLKLLLKIYEESWIDDWYKNEEQRLQYKERGKEILEKFFEIHSYNWPPIHLLECGFNFKVDNYILKGKIDRVDSKEGGIEIIDYKTGKLPRDERDLQKDQLLIYQLAGEAIFKEKVVALSYYYLDENKTFSFLGDQEEINEMKEKIKRTIEAIKVSDFKATPSVGKCQHCDFKEICEYRAV